MARQRPRAAVRRLIRQELAEGFAYVRAHAWLWATLCAAALALVATFGPFEVLLPYIIRNDLGGDAATFGIVLAAGGLGSIVAAISIGRVGAPRRHVTFMYGTWAFAIGLDVALAVAGAAWQMCAIAFVSMRRRRAGWWSGTRCCRRWSRRR